MVESVQEVIAAPPAKSGEQEDESLFAASSAPPLIQNDVSSKPLVEGKPPKPSPPSTRSSLARLASFGGADETLLQRAKHKSDELRVLFGLPESEVRHNLTVVLNASQTAHRAWSTITTAPCTKRFSCKAVSTCFNRMSASTAPCSVRDLCWHAHNLNM